MAKIVSGDQQKDTIKKISGIICEFGTAFRKSKSEQGYREKFEGSMKHQGFVPIFNPIEVKFISYADPDYETVALHCYGGYVGPKLAQTIHLIKDKTELVDLINSAIGSDPQFLNMFPDGEMAFLPTTER